MKKLTSEMLYVDNMKPFDNDYKKRIKHIKESVFATACNNIMEYAIKNNLIDFTVRHKIKQDTINNKFTVTSKIYE